MIQECFTISKKKMLSVWLKPSDMGSVGLYFSVEDESEILSWSDRIKKVNRKGYMRGYRSFDRRYVFNFLNILIERN